MKQHQGVPFRGKRAVSSIVATVLLILIVVATVGIVWVSVSSIILDSVNVNDLKINLFIQTDTGYTVYDSNKGYVFVQVARGTDNFKLGAIDIILDLDGNTKRARVIAPGVNNAQSYLFDVNASKDYKSITASVAPIFIINDKQRLGKVSSEVQVPKRAINSEAAQSIKDGNITFFNLDVGDTVKDKVPEEEIPVQKEGCKKGEIRDIWGGCAVATSGFSKVEVNPRSEDFKIYSIKDVESEWNPNHQQETTHWIKFLKPETDNSCVDKGYNLKCVKIKGVSPNSNYITISENDVVSEKTACSGQDRYYIYDNKNCE